MVNRLKHRAVVSAAALSVTGLFTSASVAQVVSWDGGTDGNNQGLYTPTSWNTDTLPPTGSALVFAGRNGTAPYIGTSSATATSSFVFVASGSLTASLVTAASASFTSLTFGTDTTSPLPPSTFLIYNSSSTNAGNQTIPLTGDANGNFIDLKNGVTSTVNFTRVNFGTLSLSLNGTGNLNVANAAATLQIGSNLVGTGAITKTGAGTLYITNTSNATQTFSGPTTIGAGTLRVAGGGSLGATANMLTIGSGTLQIDSGGSFGTTRAVALTAADSTINVPTGTATINAGISGNGTLNKVGTGTLYLTAATGTYTGGTNILAGTLQVDSGATLGSSAALITLGSATLQIDSGGTIGAGRTIQLNSASSQIAVTSGSVSAAGPLTGTGSLTKIGTGALTLSGNNTYTGPTAVNAGTLYVTAPMTATSAVTVASGATLGGNSTITPNVAVGGTIYPGTATLIGTLTTLGNVTLTDGATAGTYRTTIATTAAANNAKDVLAVGGTFDITGGTLRVDGLAGQGDASIVIATAGTLVGTFANFTGLVGGYSVDYSNNSVTLLRGNTTLYFNGSASNAFNTATNFTTDAAGAVATTQTPTASADVTFANNAATNAANYAATIGSGTTYVNSLTIDSGVGGSLGQANAGTGTLVIRGTGINLPTGTGIVVNAGAQAFNLSAPVSIASGVSQTWTSNASQPFTVSGTVALGTNTLTLAGTGTKVLDGVISGSGALTAKGSASLTAANTYLGTTTVDSTSAILTVKTNAAGGLAGAPLLSGPGGTDVRNGAIVFDYGGDSSPLATVRGLLAASFQDATTPGVMDSGQIRSSTASLTRGIGYRDDGASGITIKATLFGDADLDGGVSINDFNALAGNFGAGSGKIWTDGDFDYDGGVSINDFNLLAGGFGQSIPASSELWSGLLAFAAAHNDLVAFEAVTGVPEPASLGLIAAGATLGLRRRRR